MKRTNQLGAATLLLTLAACGPGEVAVGTERSVLDPDTGERVLRPIEGLPLQLVPFDRDFVFDSLTRAASSPEPQLSAELAAQREEMLAAQEEWRALDAQWAALRDRAQTITQEMQRFSPAEPAYRQLFNEFVDVEGALTAAERDKDAAFARFDSLQQGIFAELEQFRALVDLWEEEAFADYTTVVAARLQESRQVILYDTTDATGRVTFSPAPGNWWVHGRAPVATDELYWNVPVTVVRGEPVQIILNEGNADVRELY